MSCFCASNHLYTNACVAQKRWLYFDYGQTRLSAHFDPRYNQSLRRFEILMTFCLYAICPVFTNNFVQWQRCWCSDSVWNGMVAWIGRRGNLWTSKCHFIEVTHFLAMHHVFTDVCLLSPWRLHFYHACRRVNGWISRRSNERLSKYYFTATSRSGEICHVNEEFVLWRWCFLSVVFSVHVANLITFEKFQIICCWLAKRFNSNHLCYLEYRCRISENTTPVLFSDWLL